MPQLQIDIDDDMVREINEKSSKRIELGKDLKARSTQAMGRSVKIRDALVEHRARLDFVIDARDDDDRGEIPKKNSSVFHGEKEVKTEEVRRRKPVVQEAPDALEKSRQAISDKKTSDLLKRERAVADKIQLKHGAAIAPVQAKIDKIGEEISSLEKRGFKESDPEFASAVKRLNELLGEIDEIKAGRGKK